MTLKNMQLKYRNIADHLPSWFCGLLCCLPLLLTLFPRPRCHFQARRQWQMLKSQVAVLLVTPFQSPHLPSPPQLTSYYSLCVMLEHKVCGHCFIQFPVL